MSSSPLSKEQPPQWLDIVLKGKSAAVKAKVMELTTKMGIDPDDEFFVIFVALGQFMALLEKCPNQWDKLFTEFQGDLVKWEEDFRTSLSQTSAHTETVIVEMEERLKESLEELEERMNRLESQGERVKGLMTSTQSESKRQYEQLLREIAALKGNNQQLIKGFNQVVRFLSSPSPSFSVKWDFLPKKWVQWCESHLFPMLGSPQWLIISYLLMLLLGWTWGRTIYLPDKRLTEKMAQQTQWLLDKANRRDCLEKIKKPDSPECRSFFRRPQR